MKTITSILIIVLSVVSYFTAQAQSMNPKKSTIEYNENMRPCIVVNLDPGTKKLKKAWVKFLKKEYSLKLKGIGGFSNKDLLSAEEVVIDRLSSKQLDFYTNILEDENGSEMKVFVSLGYDIYINEKDYPDEFRNMNEMLTSFLKQYLPQYYNNLISISADRVKDINKEINSLTNEIEKNNLSIQRHTEEVTKLKTDVKDNSDKLSYAEEELKKNQEKLESIQQRLKEL